MDRKLLLETLLNHYPVVKVDEHEYTEPDCLRYSGAAEEPEFQV